MQEFLLHGLAGCTGAILSILLLFPIDNVKVRMQIDVKKNEGTGKMLDKFKQVYREEKLPGYYKGISSTLVGNCISNFTYFLCYNYLKNSVQIEDYPSLKYIICTFVAGILTSAVTNPFWVIQTEQTKSKEDVSIFQCIKKIGFLKLFNGLSASFILVLNPIINYLIYENLKIIFAAFILTNPGWQSLIYFSAGGLGKFFATIATYPYQLLRTQTHLQEKGQKKQSYTSMTQTILKEKGIAGLYVGLQAKMYQTVLSSAFTLMFYEEIFEQIKYLIEHIDDMRVIFILQIIAVFGLCLYIQQKNVTFTKIYFLFFFGISASIIANSLYLLDHEEYQFISIGLFIIGTLFYIHSIVHNISTKKTRHLIIYLVLGGLVFILSIFDKIIKYQEHSGFTDLYDLISIGLILTLIALSLLRYGKTSKKSYLFTILGVFTLSQSAYMMYVQDKSAHFEQSSKYVICFLQIITYSMLILGTTSHAKHQHYQKVLGKKDKNKNLQKQVKTA